MLVTLTDCLGDVLEVTCDVRQMLEGSICFALYRNREKVNHTYIIDTQQSKYNVLTKVELQTDTIVIYSLIKLNVLFNLQE